MSFGYLIHADMAVYSNSQRKDPEQAGILSRNIALMKQWAAEGK